MCVDIQDLFLSTIDVDTNPTIDVHSFAHFVQIMGTTKSSCSFKYTKLMIGSNGYEKNPFPTDTHEYSSFISRKTNV